MMDADQLGKAGICGQAGARRYPAFGDVERRVDAEGTRVRQQHLDHVDLPAAEGLRPEHGAGLNPKITRR